MLTSDLTDCSFPSWRKKTWLLTGMSQRRPRNARPPPNPTKEAEKKKKKAVTVVIDEEDMAGINIPTGW